MPVSAAYELKLSVTDTLTDAFIRADRKTVVHDGLSKSGTLNASSTPPASVEAPFTVAMVDGAATIDLTSLESTNGAIEDMTGLKLRIALFENPITNANPITIETGDSNGYALFGASGLIVLSPGEAAMFAFRNSRPDVASGARTIDISGVGTQVLNCHLVFG